MSVSELVSKLQGGFSKCVESTSSPLLAEVLMAKSRFVSNFALPIDPEFESESESEPESVP